MQNERKRLYANERTAMTFLAAAVQMFSEDICPDLEARSGLIPGLKRDLHMLRTKVSRVYEKMLDTVPVEQLISMKKNLSNCYYSAGVRSVTGRTCDCEHGIFLSGEEFRILAEGAMRECVLCDKCTADQYKCPLKKVLDITGTDVEHNGGCGYKYV